MGCPGKARGEHRAGHVPLPEGPAADLVLTEPGDLLGELVVPLDLSAGLIDGFMAKTGLDLQPS